MANIDVVPKRRSSVWMWVVLAAVLVALIIWAMASRGDAPRSVGLLHNEPSTSSLVLQADLLRL